MTFMILLSACAWHENQNHGTDHNTPIKLTNDFSTKPQMIPVGNEAQLIAYVTKQGKPVNDATIEMELWRDGDQDHEKLKATGEQAGNYTVKKGLPKLDFTT
ncbi:FixH family protein [Effusibacillus consociatus]|uniref:FixH family protein n=2 Tax=Effusibacillus consociatus TaxID=1117041 RepID=A0ABV9PY99_9BACL